MDLRRIHVKWDLQHFIHMPLLGRFTITGDEWKSLNSFFNQFSASFVLEERLVRGDWILEYESEGVARIGKSNCKSFSNDISFRYFINLRPSVIEALCLKEASILFDVIEDLKH